jgi:antitoxin HicB
MKKKHIGSWFDSLLRKEGIYEEVTATAIKRVLARQVEAAMKEKHFSKAEMARRMHTSRAALDRLLDPDYDAVTLNTLRKQPRRWTVNFGWNSFESNMCICRVSLFAAKHENAVMALR